MSLLKVCGHELFCAVSQLSALKRSSYHHRLTNAEPNSELSPTPEEQSSAPRDHCESLLFEDPGIVHQAYRPLPRVSTTEACSNHIVGVARAGIFEVNTAGVDLFIQPYSRDCRHSKSSSVSDWRRQETHPGQRHAAFATQLFQEFPTESQSYRPCLRVPQSRPCPLINRLTRHDLSPTYDPHLSLDQHSATQQSHAHRHPVAHQAYMHSQ
nr:hypothetical protein CFP56_25863 [Quercus suber]